MNIYEAKFIFALLDYLCQMIYHRITGQPIVYSCDSDSDEGAGQPEEPEAPEYSIGVILTYKAQVDLLQQMVEESTNEAFKHIQISTVDAFQGSEKDIIILGCVRTKNLGFTEDCRRLNVAITRARRHLIVLGKESLLRRNSNWRYIIDKSKSKNEVDKQYGYFKVSHFLQKVHCGP